MTGNAQEAKHLGGILPLGYGVNDQGKYYVIEFEAELVKMIFKLFREGKSYTEIIAVLNAAGYKNKRGRPFNKTSIHDLIKTLSTEEITLPEGFQRKKKFILKAEFRRLLMKIPRKRLPRLWKQGNTLTANPKREGNVTF